MPDHRPNVASEVPPVGADPRNSVVGIWHQAQLDLKLDIDEIQGDSHNSSRKTRMNYFNKPEPIAGTSSQTPPNVIPFVRRRTVARGELSKLASTDLEISSDVARMLGSWIAYLSDRDEVIRQDAINALSQSVSNNLMPALLADIVEMAADAQP